MKLESQVTSLEISQRLKKLGVKQESLFWWAQVSKYPSGIKWDVLQKGESRTHGDYTSAFTVAELGEMLPKEIGELIFMSERDAFNGMWVVQYVDDSYMLTGEKWSHISPTEADARGLMLVYLLENKLITIK